MIDDILKKINSIKNMNFEGSLYMFSGIKNWYLDDEIWSASWNVLNLFFITVKNSRKHSQRLRCSRLIVCWHLKKSKICNVYRQINAVLYKHSTQKFKRLCHRDLEFTYGSKFNTVYQLTSPSNWLIPFACSTKCLKLVQVLNVRVENRIPACLAGPIRRGWCKSQSNSTTTEISTTN